MRLNKKSSFLLIEILIAFSLVMTILFPLLKPLIAIHACEREQMEKVQLDREFLTFLVDLKTELFEQKIPWKNLEKGVPYGTLPNEVIIQVGNMEKKFQRAYTLTKEDSCKKTSIDSSFLLLNVKCLFQEKGKRNTWEYVTSILVEKVTT